MMAAALIIALAIVLHPFAVAVASRIVYAVWPLEPFPLPPDLPPPEDIEQTAERMGRGLKRGLDGEGWRP
jgi:hypothetical protein